MTACWHEDDDDDDERKPVNKRSLTVEAIC